MTEDELITLVAFYDTNENRDTHMVNIENLLRRMDIRPGHHMIKFKFLLTT